MAAGARAALSAVRWLYVRALSVRPSLWAVAVVSGFVAVLAVVSRIDGVSKYVLASGLGAFAFTALAALVTWAWTIRPTRRLLIFLTPFDERSADLTFVAHLQVAALRRSLQEEPLLEDAVEIRGLRAPLRLAAAGRLLVHSRGHAILGGEVVTAGGHARWDPWLMIRWRRSVGYLGLWRVRLGRLRLNDPTTQRLAVEAAVPVAVFTERDVGFLHVEVVVGTMLVLAALDKDTSDQHRETRLAAAETYRAKLPVLIRALLSIAQAGSAWSKGSRVWTDAALSLAELGDRDADHPYLWREVATLMTFAEREGEIDPHERLPYARRAAEGAPDHGGAQFGLGASLMATGEEYLAGGDTARARGCFAEAVGHFTRALELQHEGIRRREIRYWLRRARAETSALD
jgi:hypothetical protein